MSKKLKRSAVALVLAATMVFSSQGVLTAFAVGENETSTAVDVSALEPILDKEETVVIEEPGNTDETETPEVEVCEECQGVNGNHAETCPHYVDPNTPPENPTDDENNNNQEQQECTCGAEEGQPHEEGCPLYEEATIPECTCGAEEGQPHEEGCPLYEEPTVPECTCGAEEGQPHQEGCPLYEENTEETQEPSEEDVAAAKNVSDLIGALPEASTLDPETTDVEVLTAQVKAAREAYDKLTDAQKALVEKAVLDKLVALEGALEALQNTNVAAEGDVAQIGDHFYSTLSSAISAANSGDTIYILKDFTLDSRITYKDKEITIAAADNSTFTIEDNSRCGISISGDSKLTFKNLTFATNGQIYLYNNANLTFQNSTLNMDGEMYQFHSDGYYCIAIALENRGTSLSFNDSTVDIANYPSSGSAIRWDDSIGGEGYAVSIVNTEFTSSNCYSGFVGTCNILIDNSRVHVKHRGNGSNGSNFDVKNYSNVVFEGNGSHGISATSLNISDHSVVTSTNNKMFGIYVSNGFSVDGTSTLNVTQNSSGGDFAGLKLTSGVTDGLVEAGATINITDNYCSGLSNNGVCEFEEGVNLTITGNNNDKGTSSHGGGIYNSGNAANLTLPSDAVIYNNHADTAGDDIFNNTTSTITFGKVGSDWTLEDCGDEITGWFDDSKGSRWEAHDAPYHAEEFDEFEKLTSMATITGLHALKAAHGIDPIDPGEPGGGDWDVEHSKSKTVTPLDANYESDVTLSLPSAEEQLESDVVFVLDKSTSTDIEDEALAMLEDLQGQIAQTGAKVNVGVVIFNKEANRVLELTELTEENMSRIEEAIRTTISSGTNTHAGLLAGKSMLDSDTSVDSSRKYLVFVSDAITYMFNSGADYDPTAIAMENGAPVSSGAGTFAGPENWLAKYGDNNGPENWDTWFTQIKAQMEADKDTYYVPYAEQYQNENHISWDERAEHATSVDTALYLTNEVYQSAKNAGYHCYAMKATSNADHPWASRFMDYLANGQEVSFEDIQNDIFYLLDEGSSVVDVIGFGTDNAGNEYNFDFVDNLDNLKITVGGNELDKEDIIDPQFNDPYVTSAYGFGKGNEEYGYDFVLKYYQKGQDGNSDECFVWEINVPVSNFAPVQLTYTVKLTNPQTAEGTYGEYDANGENGSTSLYTNKEATLYPVDSNGDSGVPENFPKPTVSYTVGGNDNPGTDPTPDPDPDPDRPSRPNRGDDDDWEPLPDAPVKDKPTTEVDVPEETETPTTEQPDKYNPETGDTTTVFAAMALAAVSLGGVVLLGRKKK